MGLDDEYALEPVETEADRRAGYDAVTDPADPETQLEQDLQALKDYLAETENGEIEVPEMYKHHTPKDRTKSLRKLLTGAEDEGISFRGHYHDTGWYRG